MQNQDPTPLEALCKGVMPHIAQRIKRAYWIGAAEGADAMRERDKRRLLGEDNNDNRPALLRCQAE